ncbi:MAG: peptidyl-prolyl cis-trans isomerase [Acidobacteriota bacterium]|nr:peptidyl-prolyl cis-trans isomerase [Acidobacteriota bacterium]
MTMLDRMRRHKGWLKWSLAIVVLAFILLYIPSFLETDATGAGNSQVVASVDGRDITAARFRRVYQQQMQAYRSAYGANVDERMLKQLGIDQRIVQQMLEEETALAEAGRLGMTATDEEVRERIAVLPALQENGRFIGEERYRQLLQMQNPPLRPDEFEDQVRRGITVEKLQAALTHWITVSDKEVDDEFRRRNEKVKLAVVSFPADRFRTGLEATDAELTAHFEAHKNELKIPEKRKVRYALIDMQANRERIKISEEDLQRSYEDNQQQYSTPEQVRASHILLKTEGKDEAAVRKQAEDLLAKVRAGGDFGKLATQFSEDDVSKAKAGDLDYFNKGQMVPEFDKVAFELPPGQISDLVKTQYGFHIIKVIDKKAAVSKPLAEVRAQIEDQLKWDRAQTEAQRTADDLAAKLKAPGDFDTVAKPRGLTVGESGLFSREEPISGLGMAPAVAERAFELKEGEVSDAIRTPQGFAFVTLTGRQDSYVPKFEEVKARVSDEVLKRKALDLARERAAALSAQMKSGDFNAAAKAAGLEVKTTELIARGTAIPDIGASSAIDAAAFALPAGGVSDPVVTDTGAVIVKVLEKRDAPAPAVAATGADPAGAKDAQPPATKDSVKTELLNERRNRFYASYMTKARERMKVNINRDVIAQLVA